jgi:hypothetical protein
MGWQGTQNNSVEYVSTVGRPLFGAGPAIDTLAGLKVAAKIIWPRGGEQRVHRAFGAGGWPILAAELLVGEPH